MESFLHKESCVHCNGNLRPNVVLFGEHLPQISWNNAMEAIKAAELVLVIGTSLEVFPVNQLPMMTKGKTAYINLDIAHHAVEGKVKEVLQQLSL